MAQLITALRRLSALGPIALVLLLSGAATAPGRSPQERDLWYAYVEGDLRYGSQHLQTTELPDGNHRYDVDVRVLIDLLGSRQEVTVDGEYVVTPELRPVSMRVETEQLSSKAVITGRATEDGFVLSFDRSGAHRERVVAADPSEPLVFSFGLADWLASLDPATGRATARTLNEIGDVEPVVATRLRRDADGSEWRLELGGGVGPRTLTFDAQGVLVRSFGRAPREEVVRCTAEEAGVLAHRKIEGREWMDYPLDRPIPLRHRLKRLVVELTWKDVPFEAFELEDARQRLLERGETESGWSALVEIVAPPEFVESATIPVQGEAFTPYLAETEYIKPADPKIVAAARETVGETTDAGEAVTALSSWVSDFVEGEMIAETLSGPEVLACGKGKCSEYSTLFASMARSVGIPTRIVLGQRLVGQRWMGHMWNEAWVGRWVTVDATEDEVGGSLLLLKLGHSDSIREIGSVRWALPESLSISVRDYRLGESELAGLYETGIEGGTYTNIDYAARITVPSDEWTLSEGSQPGAAVVAIAPPRGEDVSLHFVAFPVPEGAGPEAIVAGRLALWKSSFESIEELPGEPREVAGASGRTIRLRGRREGDEEAVLFTEVCWVRGPAGFLLAMNTWESEHADWLPGFEELLEGFRFLGE